MEWEPTHQFFLLAEIFTPEIDKLSYNKLQLCIIITGKTTPYSNKIINLEAREPLFMEGQLSVFQVYLPSKN